MEQVDYISILEAIKLDNLVLFSGLVRNNEKLSLGRFPLLSLCYLYNAKKIINEYKAKLIKLTSYRVVSEPLEIYQTFKIYAGRNLRLYVGNNGVVSPIEMLAILGCDREVKKLYKFYLKNNFELNKITSNLKSIYLIKNQKFVIENSKLKISAKRLTKPQKFYYKLAVCIVSVFIVLLTSCFSALHLTLGLGLTFSPFKVYNQNQLYNALKTNGVYELQNNIDITKNFEDIIFYGTLNGNSCTLNIKTSGNNCLIETNQGTINNLKVTYGNVETEISKSLSLFVGNNKGTIKNINLTCESLNVKCNTSSSLNTYVSGITNINSGNVENCNVSLNANLQATGGGECLFSGIVGENYGTVSSSNFLENCNVETTEVDIAGICAYNAYNAKIENCTNKATLSQTSDNDGWSPTVAGINSTNYGSINNCINYASLKAESQNNNVSDATNVFVGGISALNYGYVFRCLNKGELIANSKTAVIYAGGITAHSTYWLKNNVAIVPIIDNCGVECNINVETENKKTYAFVGGLSGFLYGDIVAGYSLATFTNGYNQDKYFVGLCLGSAYLQYQLFNSIICFEPTNNYVLYQTNVNYHVGSLIYQNQVVDGALDINQGITTCFSISDITNGDIYWNETM